MMVCKKCFDKAKFPHRLIYNLKRRNAFRDLVAFLRDSCGEAVSFLSQIIVTFLSERRLHPDVLKTLSTLGKLPININF
jgi:hypothetical protein